MLFIKYSAAFPPGLKAKRDGRVVSAPGWIAALLFALGVLSASTPALVLAQANSLASTTAFITALEQDNDKDVRTWLVRGIDPNLMTADQTPALVLAASKKAYRAVLALLETGETDVNRANVRGETALMLACLHGELAVAKRLLAKGAEVNKPDWTPLHYAASGGHLEIVKLLIDEHHAYVDAQSPNRTTPLMMAARHRNPAMARLLVEEGADPTQRNEAGLTVADYFKRYGALEQAQWFADRARDYEARYGTVDKPRTSEAPKPSE